MLTLLHQSQQTPCLFAIVMAHSGFVVLEEMTDAEQSLSWDFGTMNSATVDGVVVGEAEASGCDEETAINK